MSLAAQKIQYTSRTYTTTKADLDLAYPGKPAWFKDALAGVADVLHRYIDAYHANNFIGSAFTRRAMWAACRLINYTLDWKTAATVNMTVTLAGPTTLPRTITAANLKFSTVGTSASPPVVFSATSDFVFDALSETVAVSQGEPYSGLSLGTSDGTAWQEFEVLRVDVLQGTNTVTAGADTYTEVTTWVNSLSTSTHFRLIPLHDGQSIVQFGNGTYGKVPPNGTALMIAGRVGGGTTGNVAAASITVYLGNDSTVTTVTNAAAASGGADEESINDARQLAPIALGSSGRAVLSADLESLSLAYTADGTLIKCGVLSNTPTTGEATLLPIPSGGGQPSGTLKTNLAAYIQGLTILGVPTITAINTTYVAQNWAANVKRATGTSVSFAELSKFIKLAIRLHIDETAPQVQTSYSSGGALSAISQANTLWSLSLGTDSVTIAVVNRMIPSVESRDHGDDINLSRLYAAIGYITTAGGLSYLTFTTPAADVVIAAAAHPQSGTFTLTEV